MTKQDIVERQVTEVYTWAARAARKNIKRVSVPDNYREAAQHIADQGNGFSFDGKTLIWE